MAKSMFFKGQKSAGSQPNNLSTHCSCFKAQALNQPAKDASPPRAWQRENDRLMTMLGRPGRDVVVTSRGEMATPLLALELINGEKLEELVREGGRGTTKTARRGDAKLSIASLPILTGT